MNLTADDIVFENVPSYLISARKSLSDVEAVYNDPQMTVALKRQRIASIISGG